MKITNSDFIKNREKELLETISGDLDRDSIRKLLVAKYGMDLDCDSLTCRDGELVVHDNQVAYKLNFEVTMSLSLLFSRQGECLEIIPSLEADTAGQAADAPEQGADAAAVDTADKDAASAEDGPPADETGGGDPAAGMASSIADMISEINKM